MKMKTIKPDEIALCVCCKEVADELELPSDTVVVTDLIPGNEVYAVSRDDFLAFLEENGMKSVRRERRRS